MYDKLKLNIQYVHLIIFLFATIILLLRCSSNRYVVYDYRGKISNAEIWKQEYIVSDSVPGIKLDFVSLKADDNVWRHKNKLYAVSVNLWKYPLDTVVQKQITRDHQMLPLKFIQG